MSDFVVSARKYRPSSFNMVVGQQHITTTLKNAIRNRLLAQAFLFCGPRGVGKTTCARILAKTINCTNLTADNEACNACPSCDSFNSGQSLNIFELDAASNNSVEDIRNLNEQVRFAPQSGKYKIYIIDEVHMLSASAFNAFLKTLEEPPSYAVFILATTEKHKILPTILSRCQIFDFNRIKIQDIAGQLAYIAGKEGIQTDPDALHLIARKADGAMRDALSVFDQIVSFTGNRVTYKDVIQNLNVIDYEYYFKITNSILNADTSDCLLVFNELLEKGFDGHQFINGLSHHLRNLLVCNDPSTLVLLEVSENIRKKYAEQAKALKPDFIFQLLSSLYQADITYRNARNQKLHAEIALLRLCSQVQEATEKKNPDPPALKSPDSQKKEPAASAAQSKVESLQTVPASALTSGDIRINTEKPETPVQKVNEPVMLPFQTPSIKIRKKEMQSQDADAVISESLPQESFTEKDLQDAWHALSMNYHHAGRKNIYTAMQKRRPVLKGTCIEFELDNLALQKEFEEARQEIVGFLRKTLRNHQTELKLQVTDVSLPRQEAYTASEKFRKMAERNPALEKLRQHLGLEF